MAFPIRRVTPQPLVKVSRPRRIVPAPLAAPQPKPTFALRGKVWIPLPKIRASRRVVPAPLAAPQPTPTFARRGKVWLPLPKIRASRRVVPAPVVAAAIPPATIALQGIKRVAAKVGKPRFTLALPASPQVKPTFAQFGIRRGPVKSPRSRLVAPSSLASPQATPTFARQVQRRGISARSQSWRIVPASSGVVVTPSATWALQGVRRSIGKVARSRFILAPPPAPQAPSTRALQGVRRVHPKRAPLARLFVAPVVALVTGRPVGEPTIATGFAGRSQTVIGGRSGASIQGKDSVSGFSGRDQSSTGGRSNAGGN